MGRQDLSVGQRLALGFGAVVALVVVLFAAAIAQFSYLDGLQNRLQALGDRVDSAAHVESSYLAMAAAARSYAFTIGEANLQLYRQASTAAQSALKTFESLPRDRESDAQFAQISPLANQYLNAADRFVSLTEQSADAQTLYTAEAEMADARARFLERVDAYLTAQRQEQQAANAAMDQAQTNTLRALLFLGGLIIAVSLATAVATALAVRGPVRRLAAVARALTAGNYAPVMLLRPTAPPAAGGLPPGPPRDELRLLSDAMGHAASTLAARERRLDARNRVSAALAASIEVERVATDALTEIVAFARCEFGAVYTLSEDARSLRRVATYALDAAEAISADEGIPSAALAARRMVVVRDLPPDAPWRVRFGFTELPPRMVVAAPLVGGERVVGLLLLGSVRDLGGEELGFVENSVPQLALSLQNALAHREVSHLAAQLQAANEELQAQNEEIQAQSEEIQAQNEELQTQGEELQRQNESLLEADRQKDEFLALASHELKSPITSIKGYSQLLLRRAEKEAGLTPYCETLRTIDRSSNTLLQRINRLLDVSRARMGRLELHPEALDLVTLARQQVELAQMRSDVHRFVVDAKEDGLVGAWDRSYLEQALANLLDNAIRYSPQGGEVRLSVRRQGGEAVVAVSDQGIGMPPEALARIFRSYYRHDSAKQVTGDGLGVGLFLTGEIVAAHGGRAWAESEPGAGSTFYLALPLAEAVAASAESARVEPPHLAEPATE